MQKLRTWGPVRLHRRVKACAAAPCPPPPSRCIADPPSSTQLLPSHRPHPQSLGPDDDRLANSSNGSLIAVSYEARAAGVKRNMRGGEARALCTDLQLVQVPTAHGRRVMGCLAALRITVDFE